MQHILVVEDEAHLAGGIEYNLQAEGYQVTVAPDGVAALEAMARLGDAVDLVVLDIMLPGMSGYDVCQNIRQEGRDVPILFLSARTLSEDRARGFDVGADQFLNKPFELDELLSRIKNLLSRRGRAVIPPEGRVFRFGNAQVDYSTYEVRVGGEPVKLTELEMKLLRYFLDNEGRVIRRSELLEEVWEVPGSVQSRAVDQFISRLRKTFEENPGHPRHFITIRDAGYRFLRDGLDA